MVSETERWTVAWLVYKGGVDPNGCGCPLEAWEKPWGCGRRDGGALLKITAPGSPVWMWGSSISYTVKTLVIGCDRGNHPPPPSRLVLTLLTTVRWDNSGKVRREPGRWMVTVLIVWGPVVLLKVPSEDGTLCSDLRSSACGCWDANDDSDQHVVPKACTLLDKGGWWQVRKLSF